MAKRRPRIAFTRPDSAAARRRVRRSSWRYDMVRRFANGVHHPDRDARFQRLPPDAQRDIMALVVYELRYRASKRRKRNPNSPYRQARDLLWRWLTPAQRAQWARTHMCFDVIGSAGGRYRLYPETHLVERIERHGQRWRAHTRFCLHDEKDDGAMPEADVSLGQLLWLAADEPAFLAMANARDARRF